MKRFFFCLYALLIISPYTMAANQFPNSPNFINYYSSERYLSYVDINSIENLRKDPPYYEAQASIYSIDFISDTKIHSVLRYFYNSEMKTVKIQIIRIDMCDNEWRIIKRSIYTPSKETFSDDAVFWGANIVFDHAY